MGEQTYPNNPNIDEAELKKTIKEDRIVGVTELAEHFDVTRKGMRDKLNSMVEAGDLKRRKIGRTNIYIDPNTFNGDCGGGLFSTINGACAWIKTLMK